VLGEAPANSSAVTFGAVVFFDRNVVLAGPYAEVLAPELARVMGSAAVLASPQSVERIEPPDPHDALAIASWPGVVVAGPGPPPPSTAWSVAVLACKPACRVRR
jgi:hypothetical protein